MTDNANKAGPDGRDHAIPVLSINRLSVHFGSASASAVPRAAPSETSWRNRWWQVLRGGVPPGQNTRSVRHAVDDVSFSIAPGEIVGLVGESGSGKSTIARVLTAMQPATHGDVRYKGSPLSGMNRRELRAYRTHVQMVFQNPAGSLNPRMRIGDAISEAVRVRDGLTGRQARLLACDALEKVGLLPEWHDRYPNAFSGGQRQRIVIARALSLSPKVLICDEPVSALDVSVQAQILELIVRLRATLGLACLFISHDLDVIRHVSDRVAVLYRGKLVEIGETRRVLTQPQHDYTRTLLASTPIPKWLRG